MLRDRHIVDAGFAAAHQAGLVELPLLVAVGAMPLPGIVVPFVLKAHRDMVAVERPEILDQAVLMLFRPFAGEEGDDGGAAFEKLGAVAPAAAVGSLDRWTALRAFRQFGGCRLRAWWVD